MTKIQQKIYTGERPLFQGKDLQISNTIFGEGESPLKESENIELEASLFKWKYPLWYSNHITMNNCTLFDMARAGIWYTNDIKVTDSVIEAPKNFRRATNIVLNHVDFPNAEETMWNCDNVKMENVTANGDYFAMNTNHMDITNLILTGNYSFDGSKDVTIRNSKLLSKDAFWNTENVTVYDSFISGEYLGWNAKNLTLVNCTIESLQGMCYIDQITMKNCRFMNTTLAFEYSTVDVDIVGSIDSVKNPLGGKICADHIDELIVEKDKVDPNKTTIVCKQDK